MNVDTDVQYAFTRAIPGHFSKNYDGVLKVEDRSAHTQEITVGSVHHMSYVALTVASFGIHFSKSPTRL